VELLGAILLIGAIILFVKRDKDPREQEASSFRQAYQGCDLYISQFNGSVLALARDKQLIVLGTLASYIERDLSTLASVSVEKDGQGLTVTNRGSQAMGAAVGGVLLGPLGVLIGGMSGAKSHKTRVSQLALKIVIDDPDMPVHRIVFFEVHGAGIEASDRRIRAIAERVEHFYALLSNAIRAQATAVIPVDQTLAFEHAPLAIEDRLEKLWRLKEAGAISAEEFDIRKSRLLASDHPAASG
jgi:hypothetical protein